MMVSLDKAYIHSRGVDPCMIFVKDEGLVQTSGRSGEKRDCLSCHECHDADMCVCVFLWLATDRPAGVGDPLEALFCGFKLVVQLNSL